MSITFKCTGCDKVYRVGDDKAGKRMRCKECNAVIAVPVPEAEAEMDWDDDFGEAYEDEPVAARRAKPSAKRKKKKSDSNKPIVKILVSAVSFLIAFVVFYFGAQAMFGGGEKEPNQQNEQAKKAPPAKAIAWDESYFLQYATPDCIGAVVFQPAKLANSKALSGLPKEMWAETSSETGADLRTMKQIAILFNRPLPGATIDENFPITIVRFDAPTDITKFVKRAIKPKKIAEATHQGKPYLKMTRFKQEMEFSSGRVKQKDGPELPPSGFYLLDDQTVVIASESDLKKIIAGENSPGDRLNSRIKEFGIGGDLTAVFLVDESRDTIRSATEGGMAMLVPGVAQAVSAADIIKTLALSLDLDGESLLRIEADGTDADSAEQLQQTINDGVAWMKQKLDETRGQAPPGGLPPQAMVMFTLAESLAAGIKVVRSEDRVSVEVKNSGELASVISSTAEGYRTGRAIGQRIVSKNKLKQIGLAFHNYHEVYGAFPATAMVDKQGKPLLSWRVQLLPFLNEPEIYEEFHLDEPWDSPHNKKLIERMPDIYASDESTAEGETRIMVFVGRGAPFGGKKPTRIRDILDGTSNTILAIEAGTDKAVPWSKPSDLGFFAGNPKLVMGKYDGGTITVIMADGAVRTLSADIPSDVVKRLITHADHSEQPVDLSEYEVGPQGR